LINNLTVIIYNVRIGQHVANYVTATVTDGSNLLIGFTDLNSIGPFTINTRTQELIFEETAE
jgi:hypothetical protein